MAALDPHEEHRQLAVLLLDDDEENRALSAQVFESEMARAVEAASAREAERELISHPGIDVVSLDVSLRGAGRDKEGAELAVKIRAAYPDLPIIGYSAYFSEDDLSTEERDAFTEYFERAGSIEDIDAYVNHCLDEGLRYREERRRLFAEQIDQLEREGRLGEAECSILRSFTPDAGQGLSIERALTDAGYHVHVVLPTPPSGVKRIPRRPLVVWVRQLGEDGEYEAEVFGQPTLYGVGSNPEDALRKLMEIFWLFVQELSDTSEEELGGPALSLAHFLDHVLMR